MAEDEEYQAEDNENPPTVEPQARVEEAFSCFTAGQEIGKNVNDVIKILDSMGEPHEDTPEGSNVTAELNEHIQKVEDTLKESVDSCNLEPDFVVKWTELRAQIDSGDIEGAKRKAARFSVKIQQVDSGQTEEPSQAESTESIY